MEGLLTLLLLVLVIRWLILASRFRRLERRIAGLEACLAPGARASAAPEPAAQDEAPPQHCAHCGFWSPPEAEVCGCGHPFRPPEVPARDHAPSVLEATLPTDLPRPAPAAAGLAAAPEDAGPARPGWADRLRERLAGEEWEAVIGGSWLNKLGALVLVVGLALFLRYSLAHLGPAGKIAVGLVVGGAMLGTGVALERRARYVVFARGLIGGGWAALYFTVYAMHGLDATRIVDDPLAGMLLLGAVAAALILHSLRYRSETVTGLAYAIGFVTIAISPVTAFSRVASVPLAASLLFVAHRFGWTPMAVGGVVATYATYALRLGVEPTGGTHDLAGGQATLALYWLVFEAFDLATLARARAAPDVGRAIFPLNAAGFVGVSLLHWSVAGAARLDGLLAAAGAAYLLSAVLRARLRPPGPVEDADDAGLLARVAGGGYEAAVTVAVALVTPAIFLRFSGFDVNLVLLLEGEFLFLAGLGLGAPTLRALAAAVFALAVAKLGLADIPGGGARSIGGLELLAWTPTALGTAAVFYASRALVRPSPSRLVVPERGLSYVASACVAVVLGFEIPLRYLGVAGLAAAVPLFELGLRGRLPEFRFQAYGMAALGLGTLAVTKLVGLVPWAIALPEVSLAFAALAAYGGAARLGRAAPGVLAGWERGRLRDASTAAGTGALLGFLWYALPTPVVALGWGAVALLLLEPGAATLPALRVQGHVVAILTLGRLLIANFTGLGETAGVSHRLLTVLPVIVLVYYVSTRCRAEAAAGRAGAWEARLARGYLYAPPVLAILLLRFEAGRVLAVAGWALVMLVLVAAGNRLGSVDLRWQGYAVAVLTFVRSWQTSFYAPESLAGPAGRIATGAIVIAGLYLAQSLSPRRRAATAPGGTWLTRVLDHFDTHARPLFGTLATVLLTLLLFHEVSGRLLTVAWGLEGIALAVAGFLLRERSLRVGGLILLGACVLKVFLYDLRELETLFRILSFVVLGLVLLGVSLVYTRFRDQLRRYL